MAASVGALRIVISQLSTWYQGARRRGFNSRAVSHGAALRFSIEHRVGCDVPGKSVLKMKFNVVRGGLLIDELPS